VIHPIVRMYDSEQNANDAVGQLKYCGVPEDRITVVGPGDTVEDIASAIMAAYVLRADALVYAEGVAQGRWLVVVQAPFGTALSVGQVLDRYQPVDSGVRPDEEPAQLWDEAAPFSSMLSWPVLSKASSRTIVGNKTTSSALNLPEITESGKPSTEGMLPLLSSSPTPLSSLLHIPLLAGGKK